MVPAAITNIHQAFIEIKHMDDSWQEECRLAVCRNMKEVIETRMHDSIDANLERMRVEGLLDRRNGSFFVSSAHRGSGFGASNYSDPHL